MEKEYLIEQITNDVVERLKRLNESGRRRKAERAVMGDTSVVKTYAILTAYNPMTRELPKEYNERLNEKLKAYLKTGNFVWFPVKGKYGAIERSFIIYDISLSDALHIGEKYEQESIIWCNNETGEKQYWEQNGNGEFRCTHKRNELTDMADNDDFYTQVSRKTKFQIPFFDGNDEELNEMIKEHSAILKATIDKNVKRINEGEDYVKRNLKRMLSEETSGKGKWEARGSLFGGYRTMNKLLSENDKKMRVRELKYFHPSGRESLPNAHPFHKGGFINECRLNKKAFALDEGVHGEQYGLQKYRGGVIVFAVTINAVKLSDNKFVNAIKQFVESWKQTFNKDKIIHKAIMFFNDDDKINNGEYIGAYSVGNFFGGKYVGDNGEMYSDKSVCLEVNGLSNKSLLKLAETIAKYFRQESVLVKDLNKDKIYLADGIPNDDSFEEDLENVNTEC